MNDKAQFIEAIRILICMDFDTYMGIFQWKGEAYALEKYEKMKADPARYLCSLDLDNLGKIFDYLKGRVAYEKI